MMQLLLFCKYLNLIKINNNKAGDVIADDEVECCTELLRSEVLLKLSFS